MNRRDLLRTAAALAFGNATRASSRRFDFFGATLTALVGDRASVDNKIMSAYYNQCFDTAIIRASGSEQGLEALYARSQRQDPPIDRIFIRSLDDFWLPGVHRSPEVTNLIKGLTIRRWLEARSLRGCIGMLAPSPGSVSLYPFDRVYLVTPCGLEATR